MGKWVRLSGILCASAVVLALMPAGAFAKEAETDGLQEGQRKAVIRIVSVIGNEITYYEEEQETEAETQSESGVAEEEQASESGDATAQDGAAEGQETETETGDGISAAGQTADGASDSGRMGRGNPGRGQMNRQTQETVTVYLPVAIVVHTNTGEQKTFSILKEGDELEALFQENEEGEEVIIELWLKSVEAD